MSTTHRVHYAWVICLAGTLMLFTSIGLGVNVFSAFQPHLMAYANLTNTQGSFIITVRSFFLLVGMTTATWLANRLGLRLAGTLTLLMVAFSSFLFGAVRQFPLYCVAAALVGLSYSWAGMIPASLLISRWFHDRQALALGIVSAGTGLATIVAPVPFTVLIEKFSLRVSFWTEAVIVLVFALLYFLLARNTPEEMGLSPYRLAGLEDTPAQPKQAPQGVTKARWYAILVACFCVGSTTSLGISNMGVLYSTAGYDPTVVAQLISVMGLCMMVGKVAYGQVADRVGGRLSNYLIYALALVGFALCCLADTQSVPLAYTAMIITGLGMPVSTVALPIWARDLCGDEGHAQGLKWLQSMYGLGIFVIGPIPGALADATGSYVPTYAIFLGMLTLSLVLVAYVYARTKAGGRPAR